MQKTDFSKYAISPESEYRELRDQTYYALQGEIGDVLKAAGLVPDEKDSQQFMSSVQKMSVSSSQIYTALFDIAHDYPEESADSTLRIPKTVEGLRVDPTHVAAALFKVAFSSGDSHCALTMRIVFNAMSGSWVGEFTNTLPLVFVNELSSISQGQIANQETDPYLEKFVLHVSPSGYFYVIPPVLKSARDAKITISQLKLFRAALT
jgi:hypothetical protein